MTVTGEDEVVRARLAAGARRALGAARVEIGPVIAGGPPARSLVMRAVVEPHRGDPFPVVVKARRDAPQTRSRRGWE